MEREAAPVEREAAPVYREAPRAEGGGAVSRATTNWHSGYQGSHPLYGTGVRSAWRGGNVANLDGVRVNGNSFDRTAFNRQVNVTGNFYNRNFNGWNQGWANGGYWGSRPWGYGWYNWTPNTWGWWGGNAAAWGLAGLATGVAIAELVNTASAQQSPVIDVPDSDYQLNYGSVESVGDTGASFSYGIAGSPPILGAANCQEGLLDGQIPQTAAQAQLLNASCQVAYGPDPKGSSAPMGMPGMPGSANASQPNGTGFDWSRLTPILTLGVGLAAGGGGAWLLSRRKAKA